MWPSTVRVDTTSRSAISRLLRPRATKLAISRSRGLNGRGCDATSRAGVCTPPQAVAKVIFADPWSYAELSEAVEAWGYRCMQAEHAFIDREQVARRWWAEEYQPVLRMLRAADMIGTRTEAEAYLRVARERYRLMRTHEWSDEIIARLHREIS